MRDIHFISWTALPALILLLGAGLVACGSDTNAESAAAEAAAAEQAAAEAATAAESAPAATPAPTHTHVATAAPVPVCQDCGTISAIEKKTEKGDAKGYGAVAGAILGAAAGREIVHGKRSNRDAAAVAGAVAGGFAGHEIEKRARGSTYYLVSVSMDAGGTKTVTLNSDDQVSVGQKVRVRDGNIILR